jgi:hypothetical protein
VIAYKAYTITLLYDTIRIICRDSISFTLLFLLLYCTLFGKLLLITVPGRGGVLVKLSSMTLQVIANALSAVDVRYCLVGPGSLQE